VDRQPEALGTLVRVFSTVSGLVPTPAAGVPDRRDNEGDDSDDADKDHDSDRHVANLRRPYRDGRSESVLLRSVRDWQALLRRT